MNDKHLATLEAMLFMTSRPLSIEEIQKEIKIKSEEIEELLRILKEKYSGSEHGIMLSEVGGYRITVRPDFVAKVAHLTPHADISRGVLRILSIIAYNQPIKQSDIVKVIGNRTYEYVKELEERGFIRWEKKSRTKLLFTTSHFEEYFNVKTEELKGKIDEKRDEQPRDKVSDEGAREP